MPQSETKGRHFRFAVIEGLLFQTGMSITHESLVLAVLLRTLGASAAIVGSLSAIRFAGWSLPQLWVANALESRRHRMPVYRFGNGLRFPLYFVMALVVGLWGPTQPTLTIVLFLIVYTLSRVVAGIAAAARSDILAKVLPTDQLSSFFGMRNLVGSIGAFLVGFLISAILGKRGPSYPLNFALLLGLSGITFGVAWFLFTRINEPPTHDPSPQQPLAGQLGALADILRQDRNYRRYLLARICLSFVQVATPFYALYAIEELQIETGLVGTYLSLLTFARIISNPFWGKMGGRWGPHILLRTSAGLGILAPLLAVGLPALGTVTGWIASPAFPYLYGLVFLINGISAPGRVIAYSSYILAIAPPERRPTYLGLTNTVRGIMDLLTIAAGTAIDLWGYTLVFLAAASLIGVGTLLTWRLHGGRYATPHPE
jgi:MFS family permease